MERTPARRHVLTAVELDVLWERLALGPTPAVLRLPSPGRTAAERREVQTAATRALGRRGLAGPADVHPELNRQLRVLARPAGRLELRAWWGRSVRAVAASRDGPGVLAVRRDDVVTLAPCDHLPSGMLGVLPRARAGPGRAVAVPTAVLGAALANAPAELRDSLVARDVRPSDARLLTWMLDGTDRRAQVVAMAGDHRGPLTVLDGPRGRYLVTRTAGDDGTEWTSVAPTDDRTLRHRATELLAAAPGATA